MDWKNVKGIKEKKNEKRNGSKNKIQCIVGFLEYFSGHLFKGLDHATQPLAGSFLIGRLELLWNADLFFYYIFFFFFLFLENFFLFVFFLHCFLTFKLESRSSTNSYSSRKTHIERISIHFCFYLEKNKRFSVFFFF